jgi:hypothetical protein
LLSHFARTWQRFSIAWQHAFAVKHDLPALTPQQAKLVDALASGIVSRELTTPAIMAIESSEPLGYLTSQLAITFAPIARLVVDEATWKELIPLLERRDVPQQLLVAIEQAERNATLHS